MKRYLRILLAISKNSFMREIEFKVSLFADIFSYLLWGILNIFFFTLLYKHVTSVAGWDIRSIYILTATYILVKSILQVLFKPSFKEINSLVVDGRLDLILTKPVSSQFLISFRRIRIYGILRIFMAIGILYFIVKGSGMSISFFEIILYTFFVIFAVIINYCIWFLVTLSVFWFGRINNVADISDPLMNITKIPIEAYPRYISRFLTFVVPLIFITTIPAKVLLGGLRPMWIISGIFVSGLFLFISQKIWQIALKRYSSAGG